MQAKLYDIFPEDGSSKRSGCYIRNCDVLGLNYKRALVPLRNIDYSLEISNSLLSITTSQRYENPTDQYLDVDYALPILPESAIYKFEAEFGNVRIQGIVKEKEEAKKQFEQAKSQGRQAVIGTIDPISKDILNLEIGNIPPKTQFTVKISLLQETKASLNTFYELIVPSTISPRYMNRVEGETKILQLQKKQNKLSGKPDFTWSFKIELRTSKKTIFFDSPTHNITLLSQNQSGTETLLVMEKSQIPNKDFKFLYTTEDFHLPSYVMGNTDISSTIMLSFIPKFCTLDLNDAYKASVANKTFDTDMSTAKGQYIFFLDRSGSMSGQRIQKAREALVMFLKSLPEDSYFQVVSFGSSSQNLHDKSVKNTTKNIESTVAKVQKMQADLGGTEIYYPLQVKLGEKVMQGYPRHLFLLTDGGVSNTQGVIDMVKKSTKYCRVHTIGIGNGASTDLILGCAEAGKGKSIMISDNENPADKIIELLESTLTPIISKVNLKFEGKKQVQSIVPNPDSIPYILKDQIVNFYVTFNGPFVDKKIFDFQYEDSVTKKPYHASIQVNPQNALNQPFVDKMAHLKVLRSLQKSAKEGIQIEDQMFYVKVKDFKNEAIKYSVAHQVLSEYTAFICVGKQLHDGQYQQFKSNSKIQVHVEQPKPIESPQNNYLSSPNFYAGSVPGSRGGNRARAMFNGMSGPSPPIAMMMPKTIALQPLQEQSCSLKCSAMSYTKKSKNSDSGIINSITSTFSSLFGSSGKKAQSKQTQSIPTITNKLQQNFSIQRASINNKAKKMAQMQCDDKSDENEQQCLKDIILQSEQMGCVIDNLCELKQQTKAKKDKKKQDTTQKQQKEKQISININVSEIVKKQASNGTWSDEKFIDKLAQNPAAIRQLVKQFGAELIITQLVALWIQKHHPEKQYSLVIKKAFSWVKKTASEKGIGEDTLKQVICV